MWHQAGWSSSNVLDLYSGGGWFKSQPVTGYPDIFWIVPGRHCDSTSFHNAFQFNIYESSCYLMLYNLDTESTIK
jgi:hypothetical protein